MQEFEHMRNIEKTREELEKHRDIQQEYKEQWSEIFSRTDTMKQKFEEKAEHIKDMRRMLASLSEPFAKPAAAAPYTPAGGTTVSAKSAQTESKASPSHQAAASGSSVPPATQMHMSHTPPVQTGSFETPVHPLQTGSNVTLAPVAARPQVSQLTHKFCQKCGTKLSSKDAFCTNCGVKTM